MDTQHTTTDPNPSMRLEVHLLGRFAAFVDHAEIPAQRWPSLRATQLVQLLSLAPRHRLTREQAIDALWPITRGRRWAGTTVS
jgi:DNA-binding SARP family transcriptional activator